MWRRVRVRVRVRVWRRVRIRFRMWRQSNETGRYEGGRKSKQICRGQVVLTHLCTLSLLIFPFRLFLSTASTGSVSTTAAENSVSNNWDQKLL